MLLGYFLYLIYYYSFPLFWSNLANFFPSQGTSSPHGNKKKPALVAVTTSYTVFKKSPKPLVGFQIYFLRNIPQWTVSQTLQRILILKRTWFDDLVKNDATLGVSILHVIDLLCFTKTEKLALWKWKILKLDIDNEWYLTVPKVGYVYIL